MWDLVEGLVATLWMMRAPVAFCAVIFAGMAAVNEVGSRYESHAVPAATQNACSGEHAQSDQKDPSC